MPHRTKFSCFLLSVMLSASCLSICPASLADTGELNFKVYNADSNNTNSAASNSDNTSAQSTSSNGDLADTQLSAETPVSADTPANDANQAQTQQASSSSSDKSVASNDSAGEKEVSKAEAEPTTTTVTTNTVTDSSAGQASDNSIDEATSQSSNKVLQGYVRIVPTGTKIPIIMDTAVDSDTSQEGDEFSARTAEDLTIDGTTVIPAGSIIKGRLATLNAPKHLNRSGSVALKFDTVTTPDNRQIPLVANLVARGGVVHAKRGMKDIAIDTATFGLPTIVALGIGAVAGHSSSSLGTGGGALIGAAVGGAIGLAILLAKKGKKVDVRPGDELKIELAEDLHMPTM